MEALQKQLEPWKYLLIKTNKNKKTTCNLHVLA
jgi:hypothetical protein